MYTDVFYGCKGILVTVVALGLVFSAQALEPVASSQEISLRVLMSEPSGTIGIITFTVALEELPAASAVLSNAFTLPPQPSAVPESAHPGVARPGGAGAGAFAESLGKTMNRE
jgi:hypothetical protein